MNSTKLRWELLVGAFLVNFRLLGDKKSREEGAHHEHLAQHTQPLLFSSCLLLPTPLGSTRG